MSYSMRSNRSQSRSGRSSSRPRQSSRSRTRSSRSSRPSGRNRSGDSPSGNRERSGQSRRGTLTRPDTGYTLHGGRPSRSRRDGRQRNATGLQALLRPNVLVLLLIVLVVVVVLIVSVTSCVARNNDASKQSTEEVKPKNEQDPRVAAGVSATMTSKFTEALDHGDLIAKIAANADEYQGKDGERLLNLALTEPSAAEFVYEYPKSDKSSKPYDEPVERGAVPRLFNWDKRWGAVTYGDGPLAITGSGPTTLAMAYMGLTGKTNFSPTEIAQQASKSNYADGAAGTKSEMFSKLPSTMGLTSEEFQPAAENLLHQLGDNTVFAVQLKEDTLTSQAHWALVVNSNADGTVTVFDPTSTTVSGMPWAMTTIASSSDAFYAISASEKTLAELDEQANGDQSTDSDTTPIEDTSD